MNKTATKVVFAVVIAASGATVKAGSGDVNGVWQFKRDKALDGSIAAKARSHKVECNSHHNRFTCRYVGADNSNDSIFVGETNTARTTTVISFYQYDSTFYVTHSGKEVSRNHFQGTWYDVAGQSGDFELYK